MIEILYNKNITRMFLEKASEMNYIKATVNCIRITGQIHRLGRYLLHLVEGTKSGRSPYCKNLEPAS